MRGRSWGKAESGKQKAEKAQAAKEEMRELIAGVRPVVLRERMLKVWAKL